MDLVNRKIKFIAAALCLFSILIIYFPMVVGFGQMDSPAQKLSPHLRMLASTEPDQAEAGKKHVHLKTASKYAEPMVDALVRFQGDPKLLETYGARVRSVMGNVATVDIPLRTL